MIPVSLNALNNTDKIHVIFVSAFIIIAIIGIELIVVGYEEDQKWTMLFTIIDEHGQLHKYVDGYEVDVVTGERTLSWTNPDCYPNCGGTSILTYGYRNGIYPESTTYTDSSLGYEP